MSFLSNPTVFRGGRLVLWCGLGVACWVGTASGLSEYVLGGTQHPWREVVSGDPEEVRVIDYERDPGSIQPLYTESTFNLVQRLLDDGRPRDLLKGGVYLGTIGWAVWPPRDVAPLFDGEAESQKGTYIWHMVLERADVKSYFMDMVNQFRVARIRFYPRIVQKGDPERFPEGFLLSDNFLSKYQILINDGSEKTRGRLLEPLLTLIRNEQENFHPVVEVKLDPPQTVRYIMLTPGAQTDWEIAEFEVFGDGYVPYATYTTQIIDLGDVASWGNIRWSGINVQDPDARMFIQTRTGTDPDPVIYWMKTGQGTDEAPYDENGQALTKQKWENLPSSQRGRRTDDIEHWSFWSPPYPFEEGLKGTPITSPGPRRYIQLRVDFIPTLKDGGRIEQMAFEYSQPPCAQNVVAEIWPDEAVPAQPTDFTYALKADVQGKDTGFDRLYIRTSTQAEVRAVRIAGQNVEYDVESSDKNGFTIKFPALKDDRLLEVDFRAPVLMYGTCFDGWVSDSGGHEVAQRINAGDARPGWGNDDLAVRIALGKELIAAPQVSSAVFTPNGDGANDSVQIQYKLLKLTSAVMVKVEVYNLFGGLIKRIYEGTDPNGEYVQTWNGTDESGEPVTPGLYVYRISVSAEEETQMKVGTVAVVY